MDVANGITNSTQAKLGLFSSKGDDWVEITLPIVTVSEGNGGKKKSFMFQGKKIYKSEGWRDKHKRHKQQRGNVHLMLKPLRNLLRLPCHITFTRYAPRKLDQFDNLPMSLKYILDAVCEIITQDFRPGRADSHEGFSVAYKQESSKQTAVKIHIQNL